MGAGIAAILTYMLREDNKLSSSSCIAFGPGTEFKSKLRFGYQTHQYQQKK
jgi:hypothetical protein